MAPLCLVTGATGALGPAVAEAFLEAGYGVRSIARHAPAPGTLPPTVEHIACDLLDEAVMSRALEGVDAVVHLAALLHVFDPPESLLPEYRRVNVEGTGSLVRAAAERGVRRVVYFSTAVVYGSNPRHALTETLEPVPDTFYGRTKLEAEQIVLSAKNTAGEPLGCALRLAAVYGARIKGNYRRLVQALNRRRFIPLGSGRNRRSLVYDKDVGRAAVLAASHPAAAGEVFNISDGTSPTLSEIIAAICDALKRPAPRWSLPLRPVRAAVKTAHAIASPLGIRLPLTPATLDKYVEDVVVDSSKARVRLGFVPRYDQQSGWREAVALMRASGLLD